MRYKNKLAFIYPQIRDIPVSNINFSIMFKNFFYKLMHTIYNFDSVRNIKKCIQIKPVLVY